MGALHAVLLAGGAGTRFWPLSRASRPKQLLRLGGDEPLLVQTVQRIAPLVPSERTWVVTGPALAEPVRALVPALGPRVLVEPCARNTAPAVGLAALAVGDPDAVLAVLPSDHAVRDAAGFRRLLAEAAALAADGAIVTLGVPPTRPETGFGYLEVDGTALGDVSTPSTAHRPPSTRVPPSTVHRPPSTRPAVPAAARRPSATVLRFVEKPDAATAATYVASGRYLWNAGIFVARVGTLRRAFARYLPQLDAVLGRLGAGEDAFADAPSVSFDVGVMEPLTADGGDVRVLPAEVGWSDLGHWAALAADGAANAVTGDAVLVDAQGCIVHADGLVAAVGVRDLVIVRVDDAVLVCPRDRAQDVRAVVAALRDAGRDDLL